MPKRARHLDVDDLYRLHAEPLLVFFARRTGDPAVALDLWAETFARAVESHRSFRGSSPEEAAAWLYAIGRRQLATYHRRGRAEQRALRRLKLERPPATPEVLDDLARRAGLDEMREALAGALEQLSPGVREAVERRVVTAQSYADIATALDTTEQAVRARVSRGLSALADHLDGPALKEALHP
jgi:RNA polymerase sigma-70 factor (ECF subfamily)